MDDDDESASIEIELLPIVRKRFGKYPFRGPPPLDEAVYASLLEQITDNRDDEGRDSDQSIE